MDSESQHSAWHIFLIVSSIVFYGLMIFFNSVSGQTGIDWELVTNKTGELSDKYFLEITPAGWTFSIWGLIYAWQAVWLLYAFASIFRRGPQTFLYLDPTLIPTIVYPVYMFNNACNVAWLLTWGNDYPQYALIFLPLATFALYVCLYYSHRHLDQIGNKLNSMGNKIDVWLIRMLVHNGLMVYATWVTIATLLNFAMVVAYFGDWPQKNASILALSILVFEVLLYFGVETFYLDKYLRYDFMQYFVLIFALAGSLSKNSYEQGPVTFVMAGCLMGLVCVFTVAKILLVFTRHRKYPLYHEMSILETE